jgi:hypothetical protein
METSVRKAYYGPLLTVISTSSISGSSSRTTMAASQQAGNSGKIDPAEVLPGSLHCKLCGIYAVWGNSRDTGPSPVSRSVAPQFVQQHWDGRREAAARAGLDEKHVLCSECERDVASGKLSVSSGGMTKAANKS